MTQFEKFKNMDIDQLAEWMVLLGCRGLTTSTVRIVNVLCVIMLTVSMSFLARGVSWRVSASTFQT